MANTASAAREAPFGEDVRPNPFEELERVSVQRVEASAAAVLNRSEVEMQVDAAHRYPRNIGKFLRLAKSMATLTQEVAASCMYTLPRKEKQPDGSYIEKPIVGPSVRLAEICASAYGNLHAAARILDAEDRDICAQGVAWDLEQNVRVTVEVRRRIFDKRGHRYSDDLILVTGAAAASIALRNAVFRVVPGAYVDDIYDAARKVAIGDAKTLAHRRGGVIERFNKLGVTTAQVLAKVGKGSLEDVGFAELEILIGIGVAIREGATIEEYFAPPPKSTPAPSSPSAPATAPAPEPAASASTAPASTPAPAKGGAPSSLEERLRAQAAAKAKPSAPQAPPAPPVEACLVCGKPVVGDSVQTTSDEGVVGIRHPGCSPFGVGDADEEER